MKIYASDYTHFSAREITATVANSLRGDYVGWDDAFDAQYAARTIYASVRESKEATPLAVTRLVFKRLGEASGLLPLESGRPRIHVLDLGEDVAEVAGLHYTDKMAGLTLLGALAKMLSDRQVKSLFAAFNPKDPKTSDLIIGRAGFTPLLKKTVVHPTFKHKNTGKPVRWQIAFADQAILKDLHRRIENQLGPIGSVRRLR